MKMSALLGVVVFCATAIFVGMAQWPYPPDDRQYYAGSGMVAEDILKKALDDIHVKMQIVLRCKDGAVMRVAAMRNSHFGDPSHCSHIESRIIYREISTTFDLISSIGQTISSLPQRLQSCNRVTQYMREHCRSKMFRDTIQFAWTNYRSIQTTIRDSDIQIKRLTRGGSKCNPNPPSQPSYASIQQELTMCINRGFGTNSYSYRAELQL